MDNGPKEEVALGVLVVKCWMSVASQQKGYRWNTGERETSPGGRRCCREEEIGRKGGERVDVVDTSRPCSYNPSILGLARIAPSIANEKQTHSGAPFTVGCHGTRHVFPSRHLSFTVQS